MPDIGPRRGLAWPPPQPQEHHKQAQIQDKRERQSTRWKLQAAFQRPQEHLQTSQAYARRESGLSRVQSVQRSLHEEANDWSGNAVDTSLTSTATTQPTTMATMAAVSNTARDGEYAFDNSPMPSPALPSDTTHTNHKSTPTEDPNSTDADTTPKASLSLPSRSNRTRGIFKVSSFLNLRGSNFSQIGNGNSSGNNSNVLLNKRRGTEGGSRSTTPLESPMDAPLASPWLDFGRAGVVSRDGSGSGRDKEGRSDYFASTPATTPTLLHPSMSSTYSVPPTPVSATTPHDWKQWDQGRDKNPAFLMNAADFTWHRPSFKQIIESLQVAVVSGETVSPMYPGYPGSSSTYVESGSAERPSTSQSMFSSATMSSRSKRRPSKPTPPSPTMTGPENPIPGRYRSHIMCAIEGILDMQAALDDANRRATEAEESRVRDLVQFAGLSEEWAERERQYDLEIKQLKESMAAMAATAAAAPSPQPMRHRRMFSSLRSEESPGPVDAKPVSKSPPTEIYAGAGTQDTFMSRVLAAIESSSKSNKPKAAEEGPVTADKDKRQVKPALICDLDHDKLMSDRLFWELSVAERNKCRQRRRYASRDHQAGHAEPENSTWGASHTRKATVTRLGKEEVSQEADFKAEAKAKKAGKTEKAKEVKGDTAACSLEAYKAKRKKMRQPYKPKRETGARTRDTGAADDPAFDTSPRQAAPSRPLGSPSRPSEVKLVRWSTSQPFSPPGSEDGEFSGCDSSSSESSGDDDDGNESKADSGTEPVTTSCGDGRRRSVAESVSDCTVICKSPEGL